MPSNLYQKILTSITIIIITISISHYSNAQELRVDITEGTIDPYPIAIAKFSAKTAKETQIGNNIATVIAENLTLSGLFKTIENSAHIQDFTNISLLPRFQDWRLINASILLQAQVKILDDGQILLQARLWDALTESQLIGKSFQGEAWRRMAHILSDEIYQRVTGEKGYFDTRIVYIAESGPKDKRTKRLAIMDQDGANHKYLTDGSQLVLTPRFSPNSQTIAYLNYVEDGKPQVFLYDLKSGKNENIGQFNHMTFAPRFSFNGKKLIMSFAKNGNSDIYEMNLKDRNSKRLTRHNAIDTSPSYSPDGKNIVFNSSRGGSPQLYTMDRQGKNITRISFGKGSYTTPVWSPRGDLIAFTKQLKGRFYIGVMQPNGENERTIFEGYLIEGPTWSPNGRVIMFFRQAEPDTEFRIYSIDLTGYNFRRIITPGEASDPAWSPPNS